MIVEALASIDAKLADGRIARGWSTAIGRVREQLA